MSDAIAKDSSPQSKTNKKSSRYQFIIWILALVLGLALGYLNNEILNGIFDVIATIFTRLFQFLAIPTIATCVILALATLNSGKNNNCIFTRTLLYTLTTTLIASSVALILYLVFSPPLISSSLLEGLNTSDLSSTSNLSYSQHILSLIPKNTVEPLLSGNVLSIVLISIAIGISLSFTPQNENRQTLIRCIKGISEVLFNLIKAIIKILPIGILAFCAQFSSQILEGSFLGSLGTYTLLVLSGNLIQVFIVLPLFLLAKKINPFWVFKKMSSTLMVAFFTKSSSATLPITLNTAENSLKIHPRICRFVLPICTTINMNGCATFILISSLFVMQNSGIELSAGTLIAWVFISVFAAIGNAGVPMGCYFLTLSLMSSIGANIAILGLILPIYTLIDMVETVENVFSDSVVCTMINKDLESNIKELGSMDN